MQNTITLAEICSRSAIASHEAVAVALELIHESGSAIARPPFGPPSLDTVVLDEDGSVHCTCADASPSVPEVAIVLQALVAVCEGRVPGGLRYAIGRALLEVEAPPFDSPAEFADALERFERGDRTVVLAGLYKRAVGAEPDMPPGTIEAMDADRRRRMPSATEIRRQLRDADLRLYQIQQLAQGARVAAGPQHQRSMRGPVVACMLTGLALVVAGEAVRGLPGRGAEAATRDVVQIEHGSDIALAAPAAVSLPEIDLAREPAVEHLPVTAPARTAARRSPAATARKQPAATRASGRARPHATPAPTTVARRDDDRGLLRIRFVWDNPFK